MRKIAEAMFELGFIFLVFFWSVACLIGLSLVVKAIQAVGGGG